VVTGDPDVLAPHELSEFRDSLNLVKFRVRRGPVPYGGDYKAQKIRGRKSDFYANLVSIL